MAAVTDVEYRRPLLRLLRYSIVVFVFGRLLVAWWLSDLFADVDREATSLETDRILADSPLV